MDNPDTSAGGKRWQATIARSIEEVEALRESWQRLYSSQPRRNINSHIDRYISVVKSMGEKTRPHVILLRRDGREAAILAGRMEGRAINIAIGYKAIASPVLRALVVVHGGILGEDNEQILGRLLEEVNSSLASREVELVFFNHLEVDSKAYGMVRAAAGFLRVDHMTRVEPHWVMTVPKSVEEFYATLSGVRRRSLRRIMKTLGKEYGGQVEHVRYEGPEHFEEMLSEARHVALRTYQYAMGVGFEDNPEERMRLSDAVRHGWLRGHVLRLAGEPVAFEMALEYDATYFLIASGYDRDKRELSPGHALFLMVLEDLCREGTVKEIDFGFGEAEYKHVYCDRHWVEKEAYIFAPRVKPVAINALRTAARSISYGAKWAVTGLGAARRIKRGWRDRFRRSTDASVEDAGKDSEA